MRKLFWLCLLFGAYFWMVSTGNEDLVIEKGKALYGYISHWLKDADVDFQVKKKKISHQKRERPRRWD